MSLFGKKKCRFYSDEDRFKESQRQEQEALKGRERITDCVITLDGFLDWEVRFYLRVEGKLEESIRDGSVSVSFCTLSFTNYNVEKLHPVVPCALFLFIFNSDAKQSYALFPDRKGQYGREDTVFEEANYYKTFGYQKMIKLVLIGDKGVYRLQFPNPVAKDHYVHGVWEYSKAKEAMDRYARRAEEKRRELEREAKKMGLTMAEYCLLRYWDDLERYEN